MSALDGFHATWSQAIATFGEGVPVTGSRFDQSGRLTGLQQAVTSAAPTSGWTGAASDSYADANSRHASTLGNLAGLDKRLGAEVDRSAAVVAAGRRDLDAVRKWVVDAAATVPNTAAGNRTLWPVVSKGSKDIQEIISRSNSDLSAIAQRIRSLGGEYDELGKPKVSHGVEPMSIMGDGDGGKGGKKIDKLPTTPDTTLDLDDIEYRPPFVPGDRRTYGPPNSIEIGPGTWLRTNPSPGVAPSPPKAPLDYRDIRVLPPFDSNNDEESLGRRGYKELVPGSGAWVPDPAAPGFVQHPPEVPVDMATAQILVPGQLIPSGMIAIYPGSLIAIPDPDLNGPS